MLTVRKERLHVTDIDLIICQRKYRPHVLHLEESNKLKLTTHPISMTTMKLSFLEH